VALAMANVVWIAGGFRSEPAVPTAPLRLALPLASQLTPESFARPFAVSNDGTRVVYVGRDGTGSSLYLQDFASGELKRLSETADADAPAFSPDGRAVGFRSGSAIKVLPLDGGLPRDIARVDATQVHWAWSGPEHILVAGLEGLSRVSVNGGPPQLVAKLAANEAVVSSGFALPDGAYLVSTRATTTTDDASRVAVVIPGESERLVIAERGGSPTFLAGRAPGLGHIVYAEAGRLMALPFDAKRRVVKGSAVPIVENVAMRPNGDAASYAVSPSGTLVFREGTLRELVSIDRGSGAIRPLSANLRQFAIPRLSPDGKRLAVEIQESPHQIWMLDIERDVLVPLTSESNGSHDFTWAPDGNSILYTLSVTPPQLGWIRTNRSLGAERIPLAGDARVSVRDWSREGRLAVMSGHAVMTLQLDGGAPPKPAGAPVKIAEGVPGSFSPDGAWLAHCNCGPVTDRPPNVFIQHLPTGTEHQVSTGEGTEPVWAASGRELFFRAGRKMMVVGLAFDGTSVRIGRPQALFEGDYLVWGTGNYDVTSDGRQFVMVRSATPNTRLLSVRLHWATELERLVPIQP
jgi:serine/threonine-protein kinase